MNQSARFWDPRMNYGLPYTPRSGSTSTSSLEERQDAETLPRPRDYAGRRRSFNLTNGVRARITSEHEVSIANGSAFDPGAFDDAWTGCDAFTGDDSGYRVRRESGCQPISRTMSMVYEPTTEPRMSRTAVILATLSGVSIATAIIGLTLRFAGPSTIISTALLLVGAGIAVFVANRGPRG
jgi:hypothetical protein